MSSKSFRWLGRKLATKRRKHTLSEKPLFLRFHKKAHVGENTKFKLTVVDKQRKAEPFSRVRKQVNCFMANNYMLPLVFVVTVGVCIDLGGRWLQQKHLPTCWNHEGQAPGLGRLSGCGELEQQVAKPM